ncbi:MAG TPA: DUF4445 domain-containing protein [Phycisphaerae bacterium]|nr:DUF4445 domain-containing protein [Phycisphaerae bacterium]
MPTVHFNPSGKTVDVPVGTGLLDAFRAAGVEMEWPCGGKGVCGKCIVRIVDGAPDSDSLGTLPAEVVADGYVLACKTKVAETDLVIEVPDYTGMQGGQFSDDETHLIRSELWPEHWQYDPLAVKWLIQVPPAGREDGLGDYDRLVLAVKKQWGEDEVFCRLATMRLIIDAVREAQGLVTVTLVRTPGQLHIVGIESGDHTESLYALAIDIGTTTVAVQLICLTNAKILATRSAYNGQIKFGADVISRINYAGKDGHLAELTAAALDTVNDLIARVATSHGIDLRKISNAAISGNTTMVHLLLGMNPEYIRLEPYTPALLEVPYLTAGEVGIDINPDSWIRISPNVGSYVGGDITAGLLCTDIADRDDVSLFVDIGTNGELVIGSQEFLLTCACSAGPAFEGGGIDCGMRAAFGAIERVEVDKDTGEAKWFTIGRAKPRGICGSGMIDLLANLFTSGWIDQAGKFNREKSSPSITINGRKATYTIVPADQSETGEALTISETDVENIIRAKASIYSAAALLLDQVGMDFSDLAHVYVAGGFGRFLDLEKAIILGLLPDLPADKFSFIGNASLMGSYMVVVSQEYRIKQLDLARRMTYVDLSTAPGYMDQYTAAMFLPHTDPDRFPSVTGVGS